MTISQIYIATSIVVLAIVALLIFLERKSKKEKKLTPLAGLAFVFIFFGIISIATVQGRLISYSFMGVGVILSIIDIIKKLKSK